jgi:hypothetical protein
LGSPRACARTFRRNREERKPGPEVADVKALSDEAGIDTLHTLMIPGWTGRTERIRTRGYSPADEKEIVGFLSGL